MSILPRPWTPKELECLVCAWNLGDGATAIAKELGRTRNAIIGKVFRLRAAGHTLRTVGTYCAGGLVNSARSKDRHAIVKKKKPRSRVEPLARALPKATEHCVKELEGQEIFAHRVSLLEAHNSQCKWICSDNGDPAECCGAESLAGKSWCAPHYARVFGGQRSEALRTPDPWYKDFAHKRFRGAL